MRSQRLPGRRARTIPHTMRSLDARELGAVSGGCVNQRVGNYLVHSDAPSLSVAITEADAANPSFLAEHGLTAQPLTLDEDGDRQVDVRANPEADAADATASANAAPNASRVATPAEEPFAQGLSTGVGAALSVGLPVGYGGVGTLGPFAVAPFAGGFIVASPEGVPFFAPNAGVLQAAIEEAWRAALAQDAWAQAVGMGAGAGARAGAGVGVSEPHLASWGWDLHGNAGMGAGLLPTAGVAAESFGIPVAAPALVPGPIGGVSAGAGYAVSAYAEPGPWSERPSAGVNGLSRPASFDADTARLAPAGDRAFAPPAPR